MDGAALEHADLFFCNEGEACAIAKASSAEEAFNKLKTKLPSVVVTNGPHGAYIRHDGTEAHVPAFACEPKDLTGAGDMFAGAFLYGITHGVRADKAARAACFLATKVISKIGAWSLDHQGRKPDYESIFPRPIGELREAFFHDRKKQVRKINEDLLVYLADGPEKMQPDAAAAAAATLGTLKSRFGYCDSCARDAVMALIRKRYS